ncbi:MAG TPA: type II toxin-antitoxin system PemK/MazF family toxin [Candidatus Dormibacteraeota bacterium]|nr:type II toxin-antitoxin system PemK/MazF family toxin [Candidatus Dormibacteraeota bacterium]
MNSRPQRGDIWNIDFGRPTGHEQGAGSRPGLVISTDDFNNSGAGLVIVAPLTTSQRGYPSRIKVAARQSGLRETSWAAVEHLRSLSVLRLRDYRGSVDRAVLTEVEHVLDLLLFDRSSGPASD